MVSLSVLATYSLVVGAIALTVTKSALFDDFRSRLGKLSDKGRGWKKLNQLYNCPFCFSFWVALLLMLFRPFPGAEGATDRIFYAFALMGGGSAVAGFIFYCLKYALTEPGE